MDFELLLAALTGVSGLIYGLEVLYRRVIKSEQDTPPSGNVVVEYARSFFPVLLLVLFIRSFLFEPFRIPSGSMMPTLLVGDFIFVNKFNYGLRLPVVHTEFVDFGEPERGDVVVFRLPSNPKINYIKRLVGLPGDDILYANRRLFVNGVQVKMSTPRVYAAGNRPDLLEATEQLGDAEHQILLESLRPSREGRFKVPSGHFFFMGDNRDNSQDSRFPQVGFVPESNVVGKAVRIWMNWDFPEMPKWARIGSRVR